MNLIKTTIAACAALTLAVPAFAAEKEKEKEKGERGAAGESHKVSACDKAWAHMAAVSDKVEITLAKAAESKSQNEQVKQHAQQMIQDHTKTTEELMKWAKSNGVELSPSIPPEKQAAMKEIESKSGADFDKAYLNHEVEGHRIAAAHFQNGTEFLENQELKQFAQQNQPTINQHLSMTETQAGAQRTASGNGAQGGRESKVGNTQSNRPANAPASGQVTTPGSNR